MHYHCLIQRATQPSNAFKDKCPVCHIQIFEWDGITTLTLATRTGLELQDEKPGGYLHPDTGNWVPSDKTEYEADCAFIVTLVSQHLEAHSNEPSGFEDGSVDLVRVYYDMCMDLDRMKKPQARWLQYRTRTGVFLLGMLVAIKMRRFLMEERPGVVGTEGWMEFEEEGRRSQQRVLGEVYGP